MRSVFSLLTVMEALRIRSISRGFLSGIFASPTSASDWNSSTPPRLCAENTENRFSFAISVWSRVLRVCTTFGEISPAFTPMSLTATPSSSFR